IRHVPGMPDDVVREMGPDAHTAVVALTHDPKLDDLALLEALRSDAFYVGAQAPVGGAFRPDRRGAGASAWPGRVTHRRPHAGRDRRLGRGADRRVQERRRASGPDGCGLRRRVTAPKATSLSLWDESSGDSSLPQPAVLVLASGRG